MALSKRHRRFLIVEQCFVPTVINFVVNGLISWLSNRSATEIPLWDTPGIGIDLFLTGLLLPLLICLLVSPQIAGKVKSGKLPPLQPHQLPEWPFFKRPLFLRALFLGSVGVLLGAVPVLWVLTIGQAQPLPVLAFVVFKATWAAMLAAVVSPFIGWWALANASYRYGTK